MFSVNDALTALKDGILKYSDEGIRKAPEPVSDVLFETVNDARHTTTIGGVNGTGRFSSTPRGTSLPARAPFERAETTIVAQRLGEIRTFTKDVMAEIMAALQLPGQPPLDIVKAADDFGKSYRQTKDQICVNVLTSTSNGYDGVALFSASHRQRSKTGDGDTYDNTLTPSAGGITDANVKSALTRLQDTNAYAEDGEPVEVFATDLICTTQQQKFDAETVLRSIQVAGNNNNDKNVVQDIVMPRLWRRLQQATEYFYLFVAKKGFYYKEEQALEVETAYDFDSKLYKASAEMLGEASYADWRGVVRSGVAA